MTRGRKIQTLACAIRYASDLHGCMTGEGHEADTASCKCSYGLTVRGLEELLAEVKGELKPRAACGVCNGSRKVLVQVPDRRSRVGFRNEARACACAEAGRESRQRELDLVEAGV